MTRTTKLHRQGYDDALAGRGPDPDVDDPDFEYDRGFQAGIDAADDPDDDDDPSPRARGKTSRGPQRRNGSKGSRSKASRKRSSKASTRRALRQVRVPVNNRINGLLPAVGATIALALLYNAMSHTKELTGFLGGIGKALAWLEDPTTSIPYGK